MIEAVVFKTFTVFDDTTKHTYIFEQGDNIKYERFAACSITSSALPYIRIFYNDKMISTSDFVIEQFVQSMSESVCNRLLEHVQIQRIEGQGNTNNFLLSIPRENVIDIKPMEHNTYLVIYAEEEHEENKV